VKTYDEMMAAAAAQVAHDETLKQDPQKVEEISSRINAAAAAAGRQCGECTMCCKVMPIKELSKPAHQWCQHAKPGSGCAIYQSRPAECRGFACSWLLLKEIGEHWKPTKSKMVLVHGRDHQRGSQMISVHTDRSYPNAWRRSPYYEELKRRCGQTRIEIIMSDRRRVLMCADQDVYFDPETEAVEFNGPFVKRVVSIDEARRLEQLRRSRT
jgi:Fe-S-cluster containining protein